MISTTTTPKNKVELIRAIQGLYNPKIEVVEVTNDQSYRQATKKLDTMRKKGNLSIVLISDP